MNNLPKVPNQQQNPLSTNSVGGKSPLLSKLYSLPISQKTNLIPWFFRLP